MTIDQAVKIVYALREKNNDYPDNSSEDYIAILQEINAAINLWEQEVHKGVLWRELYTTDTVTISSGQGSAPSDFLAPASLYNGSTEYVFTRPELAKTIRVNNPSQKIYWLTGSHGDYTINTPDDCVFDIAYYKKATTYSTGTETQQLEMSDPYFAVNYALGDLYLDDDNPQAQFKIDQANEKLEAMKIANENSPLYQDANEFNQVGFGT